MPRSLARPGSKFHPWPKGGKTRTICGSGCASPTVANGVRPSARTERPCKERAMSDKEHVLSISTENRICLLTLDRPQRRNALSEQLQRELREAVLEADSDPAVSLVAITGAGDGALSAGAALKE